MTIPKKPESREGRTPLNKKRGIGPTDSLAPNPVTTLLLHRWRSKSGYLALAAAAAAAAVFAWQWLLTPPTSAAPLAEAPEFGSFPVDVLDPAGTVNTIGVGETITLRFRMYGTSGDRVHGGITVSFPGLTEADSNSSAYSSEQAEVSTNTYTRLSGNYTSNVTYLHEDDQVNQATGDTKIRPGHLIVESYYNFWPTNLNRTLTLEVTPLEVGQFPVRYRYWLCDNDWDCAHKPGGDDADGTDQQGWNVDVYTLTVEAPELDRVNTRSPPNSIELGKSVGLEFTMHMDEGPENGHGGISVSFPDLTDTGGSSSHYDSDQGKVETTSYNNGSSKVRYYDRGETITKVAGEGAEEYRIEGTAQYLLVESDDDDWPPGVNRTLKLKVTPREPGEFTIYYRYWLCDKNYKNCDHEPTSRSYDLDQQNWRAREYTVTVTEPISVTVTSDPPGRTFTVEGANYTTSHEATWESGAGLDLDAPSPQRLLGTGSRYVFSHWRPGGSEAEQTFRPTEDTTYTAHFVKQHFLATGPGQRVSGGGWHEEGEEVRVGPANPPEGQFFSHWEKNRLRIPGPAGANQDGVTVTVDDPLSVFAVYTDAPPETGTEDPSTTVIDDTPSDADAQVLYQGWDSSVGVGEVELVDTYVTVTLTSPSDGRSPSVLEFQIEHSLEKLAQGLAQTVEAFIRELAADVTGPVLAEVVGTLLEEMLNIPLLKNWLETTLDLDERIEDALEAAAEAATDQQVGVDRQTAAAASFTASLADLTPGVAGMAGSLVGDIAAGFDGYGQVLVAVPKSAWIDFDGVKKWNLPWSSLEWDQYTADEEEHQIAIAKSADFLADVGVSLIPFAGGALGATIGTGEYLSDLFPEEQVRTDLWFSPRYNNCTTHITVPWHLGKMNVSAIRITIPMYLSDDDYVAMHADFTTMSTLPLLGGINFPFVRQRGGVEINDVLMNAHRPGGGNALCKRGQPSGAAGIALTPPALTVAEGSNATYTVALESEPDAKVIIAITGQADTDLSLSHDTLAFTPDNWTTPQTVTVTAAEGDDAVPDAPITLVHTPAAGTMQTQAPKTS